MYRLKSFESCGKRQTTFKCAINILRAQRLYLCVVINVEIFSVSILYDFRMLLISWFILCKVGLNIGVKWKMENSLLKTLYFQFSSYNCSQYTDKIVKWIKINAYVVIMGIQKKYKMFVFRCNAATNFNWAAYQINSKTCQNMLYQIYYLLKWCSVLIESLLIKLYIFMPYFSF